ncbi:MAG: roadblock/LC7 domain-containing protein [Myxococcota bacterium]|nr:roadblock/LC7 domain-containing protein [Myxococcota bacterium]
MSVLILLEDDASRLEQLCTDLLEKTCSQAVLLIDRDGQLVTWSGKLKDFDVVSLASLTAGNMAATDGLAHLLGETSFGSIFHQGDRESIFIADTGRRLFVVTIFNERSSIALVRLRLNDLLPRLLEIIDDILRKSSESDLSSVGITDQELTALLGED